MVDINVKVKKSKGNYNIITTETFSKDEIVERLKLIEGMTNNIKNNITRIKTQNKRIPEVLKQVKKEITDAFVQIPDLEGRAAQTQDLVDTIRNAIKKDKIVMKKVNEMDSKKLNPNENIMDAQ